MTTHIFGLFILTLLLTGCSIDININDYIDKNAPLKLTIKKTDNSTGLTIADNFEIAVGSDKYKKLIQWGNENTDGWQQTPASYNPNIFVGQGKFRLLGFANGNGVVIRFTDKDGKPRQYTKTITQGELDFLTQ
ncbi:MAG TPA: hypothetical protein VII99_11425 [Bacteroidia bacterium]